MRLRNKFLSLIFAMFVVIGGLAVSSASAQTRGSVTVQRPIVVRTVVYRRPYYNRYWGSRFYDPFYDPYYSSPYLRYKDREYSLRSELAGNRRELQKHLEKYRADGVITAKEQRELNDDYKDVANSQRKLRSFANEYGGNY
jgi:hypothetical protein